MRALIRALLVLLLAVMALAGAAAWWISRPLDMTTPVVELSVEPGMTPREVAAGWVAAGLETSPSLLYEWFRWSGQARRIRAGSYAAEAGTTPRELLDKMVQGDEQLESVRFIEGWTFKQVRQALAQAPH
ncbi:MAG: endolytic transglycosylase MltG, partial [Rubrivivax sp.]